MTFCARCNTSFHGAAWLGEYCSRGCAYDDSRKDWKDCAPLYDQHDPTGQRVIAQNRDQVEAMLEAAAIDPRLPRIIYMRRRGKSLRDIAASMQPNMSHMQVTRLLAKVTRKLLRECGLRKK